MAEPSHTNRLAKESSPYLLQHAHNPVDWHPWGAEAFSLPQFPKCPPLGIAVKATPAELHAEIAVPAPLIQAVGEYVKEMQKMIFNRAMEQNHPPAP